MFFLNHPSIAGIKTRDLYSPRSSWTASAIIAGVAAVALLASAHTFANAEETWTRVARDGYGR
jgi:hypothetical protein